MIFTVNDLNKSQTHSLVHGVNTRAKHQLH